ncbi:GtrA family protein [Blastococcus saxobsidens]|uniref:Putative flippase GtrA n=1 Tax=Blastococcus saxobsidens TaxID=138336 RepID=A0A4Q7Y9N4_9ACTN|nr:GtrA family protein [Blastococcus saxobsidens]RZU33073.1 putative flippase GtrA [Blastococcus saxobsidens]
MSTTDSSGQIWRFLLVGGANTAVTAAALAVLAQFMDAAIAYTLVYVLGLAFTTAMTNSYVFRAERSWARRALFVSWYLGVYAIGLGVVGLLDRGHDWAPLPLALATVAVTAPLSFLGGRLIFARTTPTSSHDQEQPC